MQGAVEEQIYPHVATGFTDSNAYLRELTLKSMLVLAPKLSQRTINQSLLKFLAKLQVRLLSLPPLSLVTLLGLTSFGSNKAAFLPPPACRLVLDCPSYCKRASAHNFGHTNEGFAACMWTCAVST